MKKILFTIISLCLALTAVRASSPEWIQNCDPSAIPEGGVGTRNAVSIGAATQFDTQYLSQHTGKSISVIALYMCSAVSDVTVFVKEGEDINSAKTLAEKKASYISEGWNYVKLPQIVEIKGDSPIFIGYETTDNQKYPMAFDFKQYKGKSFISISGAAYEEQNQYGNLMMRAMTGGDESELSNNVILNQVACDRYTAKGSVAKIRLTLTNCSVNDTENMTLSYTANGTEFTKDITPEAAFESNSMMTYSFETSPLDENTKFVFSISKVNGQTNKSEARIEKNVTVYNSEDAVERTILIEKFTGQACGYCPGGEQKIAQSIAGHEDRIARIDHHYGFGKDIFSMPQSESIGTFFGVKSAPQCMLDRSIQEERLNFEDGNNEVKWHPGLMTEEIIVNEIDKPAFVTLAITSDYNTGTKELTVNVKGKGNIDMSNKKINVVLTQSGYKAYQESMGTDYYHNDFPIVFLTDYKGDALVADGDGTFDMTFSCKIEDNYGKVKVDRDKLKLVAFVSEWDTKETSEVYNAAVANVDGKTGVEDSAADSIRVFSENGRVFVEGCDNATVEVFDMTGAKVENNDLPRGLYIARVCSENGQLCSAKVIVK